MEKAKIILTSKKFIRVVWAVAAFVVVLAIVVAVIFGRPKNDNQSAPIQNDNSVIIDVASGDNLSKILSAQGLNAGEINSIAKLLKDKAGLDGLRANRDKIEISRDAPDAPISKITIMPGPWRRVELSCDGAGAWQCNAFDIERDTRMVYRQGEILDGDSFYLAGVRAGIPAGVLADVYDLLAFEMDFERDVRAGQKFSVVYEENYAADKKIDNGAVVMVSFDEEKFLILML